MRNQNPSLRFDHREIAVIFSLFIFVSLLMFTVGILVGKGLAQAKYESLLLSAPRAGHAAIASPPLSLADTAPVPEADTRAPSAAAIGAPESAPVKAEEPTAKVAATEPGSAPAGSAPTGADPAKAAAAAAGVTTASADTTDKASGKNPAQPLQLIPQHARNPEVNGGSLQEPGLNKEAEHIMKDPKIQALLDKEPAAPARNTASARSPKAASPKSLPSSFAKGLYTVQVGSYPTQKDASERVEALKKLGFPHAYFSAKELGDKKDTWYRVWLGYYPDKDSAEKSGAMLQERGEVKNYLVRKTDAHG